MQISSNTQTLQLLKAQQAWEARRASAPNQSAPAIGNNPAQDDPDTATSNATGANQSSLSQNNGNNNATVDRQSLASNPALAAQWTRKVQDIQQTAQKAGFVGVSEQDIQQAYLSGQSLLADYQV